ncbi:MAG: hypothetical protein HY554_06385 [Elusimicrobia bacterium]|nr:hypothetical protein [Elusimicrobiota bacterium]
MLALDGKTATLACLAAGLPIAWTGAAWRGSPAPHPLVGLLAGRPQLLYAVASEIRRLPGVASAELSAPDSPPAALSLPPASSQPEGPAGAGALRDEAALIVRGLLARPRLLAEHEGAWRNLLGDANVAALFAAAGSPRAGLAAQAPSLSIADPSAIARLHERLAALFDHQPAAAPAAPVPVAAQAREAGPASLARFRQAGAIDEFDYTAFAWIRVGIHETLVLHHRRAEGRRELPLLAASFHFDLLSPHYGSRPSVELLSHTLHNFSPGNHLDLELTLRLPKGLDQEPVTLRYQEVLFEGRAHTPDKFELNFPAHAVGELWKVKFNVHQTGGRRILGLAVLGHNSAGIPNLHWVGDSLYRDGIRGVPSSRLDGLETALEAAALDGGRRAANDGMVGGLKGFHEWLEDVSDQPAGKVLLREFHPSRSPEDLGRQPLLKLTVFPKSHITPEDRQRGTFWFRIEAELSTDLETPARDRIMAGIGSILAGEPGAMPLEGVWLRAPGFLRSQFKLGARAAESIDFHPLDGKFPQWLYRADRRNAQQADPEVHRAPIPAPYHENLPPLEPDAADWWKGSDSDNDPSQTGRSTLLAAWDEAFVARHGPDATFRQLLASSGRGRRD